jgi:amidase
MVPIADGSDLGGSLRNPAAFNNIVGLRPSIGRVPLADPTTHRLARLSVQGPMGRTVGDVALVLSALAGPDRRDPLALTDDPSSFASTLPTTMSATVGWIGDIDGAFACDDAPMAIARAAADVVNDAGGELVELGAVLPGAEQIFRVVRGLGFRQLAADIPADRHHELKDTIRENMAYGLALTVDDIMEMERLRVGLGETVTELFDRVDVLALPTTQVLPFPADLEFPTEVAGQAMPDYLGWMMSCCVITATECPAISIPAGFHDGLPAGLQLVGRPGADRELLEVAAAMEAARPYHHLTPEL